MKFVVIFLLGVFLSSGILHAAVPPKKAPDEGADIKHVIAKIEQVLKNQKEILKRMDEMKQELLIVKARATR